MPFIHIKSLPFEDEFDIPNSIKDIAINFSNATGIDLQHIHTTWEFYLPGYYAKGDKAEKFQPKTNHPIIVDLLTPDFNDLRIITVMLTSIADSISTKLGFPKNNIFINHRHAHSAMVFDDGQIVQW